MQNLLFRLGTNVTVLLLDFCIMFIIESNLIPNIIFIDVSDASETWKFPYESPSLRFELEDAWEQIKPLYEQLHAYVRKKLRDLYGPERISREAPLPAHVLGRLKSILLLF